MTTTQLEAGREMDALVAEKVFGKPLREWGFPPRFSTDIAAAWQIVEKMRPLGFKVTIEDAYIGWFVQIDRGADAERIAEASAPDAPLAICRAALAAVGEPRT